MNNARCNCSACADDLAARAAEIEKLRAQLATARAEAWRDAIEAARRELRLAIVLPSKAMGAIDGIVNGVLDRVDRAIAALQPPAPAEKCSKCGGDGFITITGGEYATEHVPCPRCVGGRVSPVPAAQRFTARHLADMEGDAVPFAAHPRLLKRPPAAAAVDEAKASEHEPNCETREWPDHACDCEVGDDRLARVATERAATCMMCGGSGEIQPPSLGMVGLQMGIDYTPTRCPACDGSGRARTR